MATLPWALIIVICTVTDGIRECKPYERDFATYDECADLISDVFAARSTPGYEIAVMTGSCYQHEGELKLEDAE